MSVPTPTWRSEEDLKVIAISRDGSISKSSANRFFQQFGNIRECYILNDNKMVAVKFRTEEEAERALLHDIAVIDGKEVSLTTFKSGNRKVFIPQLPKGDLRIIKEYFSQFGPVLRVEKLPFKNTAFLLFLKVDAAVSLRDTAHVINGQEVYILPPTLSSNTHKKEPFYYIPNSLPRAIPTPISTPLPQVVIVKRPQFQWFKYRSRSPSPSTDTSSSSSSSSIIVRPVKTLTPSSTTITTTTSSSTALLDLDSPHSTVVPSLTPSPQPSSSLFTSHISSSLPTKSPTPSLVSSRRSAADKLGWMVKRDPPKRSDAIPLTRQSVLTVNETIVEEQDRSTTPVVGDCIPWISGEATEEKWVEENDYNSMTYWRDSSVDEMNEGMQNDGMFEYDWKNENRKTRLKDGSPLKSCLKVKQRGELQSNQVIPKEYVVRQKTEGKNMKKVTFDDEKTSILICYDSPLTLYYEFDSRDIPIDPPLTSWYLHFLFKQGTLPLEKKFLREGDRGGVITVRDLIEMNGKDDPFKFYSDVHLGVDGKNGEVKEDNGLPVNNGIRPPMNTRPEWPSTLPPLPSHFPLLQDNNEISEEREVSSIVAHRGVNALSKEFPRVDKMRLNNVLDGCLPTHCKFCNVNASSPSTFLQHLFSDRHMYKISSCVRFTRSDFYFWLKVLQGFRGRRR